MKLYAFKSKKTNYFFKFEQLHEDGYGMYMDNISFPFKHDSVPTMFTNSTPVLEGSFMQHEQKDVELVEFSLEILS